jgi:hypothetical protein
MPFGECVMHDAIDQRPYNFEMNFVWRCRSSAAQFSSSDEAEDYKMTCCGARGSDGTLHCCEIH